MKLVVDNPMPVPAKRAGQPHKALHPLLAKLTGQSGVESDAVRHFHRFLEKEGGGPGEKTGKGELNTPELHEPGGKAAKIRENPETSRFGSFFEDLERKYKKDVEVTKPAAPVMHDEAAAPSITLIDARQLFAGQRPQQTGFDSAAEEQPGGRSVATGLTRQAGHRTNEIAIFQFDSAGTPVDERLPAEAVPFRLFPVERHAEQAAGKQSAPTDIIARAPAWPARGPIEPPDEAVREKITDKPDLAAKAAPPSEQDAAAFEGLVEHPAAQSPAQQIMARIAKALPAGSLDIRQLASGQKTVRFALQPEILGDVSVVLKLSETGVDVAIRPHLRETARLLDEARDELLQSLKLSGVELSKVEIGQPEAAAGLDVKQDRPISSQAGGQSSQYQPSQGGNTSSGGSRQNQWQPPDAAAARKGESNESKEPQSASPAAGRGIVL